MDDLYGLFALAVGHATLWWVRVAIRQPAGLPVSSMKSMTVSSTVSSRRGRAV